MTGNKYGLHRVIYPQNVFPQRAERLDNNPNIFTNEILIEVSALQLTATAFNSLTSQFGFSEDLIRDEILRIVQEYGKFQDPKTKSGGMLIGKVLEIGEEIKDDSIKIGDTIASLVSLSLTPLKIKSIQEINFDTHQIKCEAFAILFEKSIYTRLPDDISLSICLAVMDVAGAPAQVAANVKPGDIVAVVGAGKAGLLCLAEAKKRVSPNGQVVCIEYDMEKCETVKRLNLADQVINTDAQIPGEALNEIERILGDDRADFTINTVSVPDTEITTILVTKESGTIFFFSMSTDFVKASLGAEGMRSPVKMLIGNGYYPGHAQLAFDIIRRDKNLKDYFNKIYSPK